MSQIRKYESGGTSEKKKPETRTIKRGNDDIDLDRYIRNLEGNFESWLESRDLKDSEKAEVRKAYQDMLEGYNNGELTYQLGGSSNDSTGRRTNLKEGFDSYGAAQNYFNTILQKQSVYTKPSKAKFDSRKAWNDFLSKQNIDYNLFSQMDQNDQNSYLSNLLNKYTSEINGDDYEDYDTNYGQNVLNLFNQAITDPELTAKERMDLSTIGIDFSKFYPTEVKNEETDNLDNELAEIQKEQQKEEQRRQINAYRYKQQLMQMQLDPSKFRDYSKIRDYRTVLPSDLELNKYDQEAIANGLTQRASNFADYVAAGDLFSGNSRMDLFNKGGIKINKNGKTYNYVNDDYYKLSNNDQILARQKAYALDWIKYIKQNPTEESNRNITSSTGSKFNGWYIVDTDANDRGTVTAIDPKSGNMHEIPVSHIQSTGSIQNYVDSYIQRRMDQNNIPDLYGSHKQGGILKEQFGGTVYDYRDVGEVIAENQAKVKAANEKAKEEALATRMKRTGKSEEQLEAADRIVGGENGLTGVDKARLTAIGLDLFGALSSFTGVGSVVGGVSGLAGTLANLGADFADDSVSTGEMLTNLGMGTAASLIGFVPVVGGAGKMATLGKAIKYIPHILSAAGAAGIVFDDDVTKSFDKFKKNGVQGFKDGKYTNDDLRNLALAVGAVTGLTRAGTNLVKGKIIKSNSKVKTGEAKYSIETNQGTKPLTEAEFTDLSKAKTVEQATKILQSIKRGENTPYKDLTVKGKGPKWKLGLGKKDKFDTKSLNKTNPEYKYELSGDDLTKAGKFFYGNPESKWSDSYYILRNLNNPRGNISFGLGFRKKGEVPAMTNPSITNPAINVRQALPQLTTLNPAAYLPQIANSHSKQYIALLRRDWTPERIEQQLGPTFWKQGGKLFPFKYASGGILKGQSGLEVPTWYTSRYKNASLGNWSPEDRIDLRTGSNIEGFRGDAGSLNTVYSANNAYISNHDNVTKDIQSYYDSLNGNFNAEDLVAAYNADAAKIRSFWDNPVYYKTQNGINATDATQHNQLFRKMFGTRSIAKGEASGANLGYDDRYEKTAGSSTWHRRMDQYENEFDLNNQDKNRIHTITGKDGKTFQVYKKANGDIGIIPVQQDNPQSNPQVAPQTDPKSKVDPADVGEKEQSRPKYNFLQGFYPKALGISRLLGTLGTNKDIYNTVRKSISPDIIDTYELWHPVHGDLGTRNFYSYQGDQIRHRAANPATSDASLALAGQMDANKQARELEEKGYLADNQEIRRTQAESLKRVEDNKAKRTDVANKNRLSLNQHRRTLGQLAADYKLKNWNAISTYMAEQQQEANQNYSEYKNFMQSYYDTRDKLKFDAELAPYLEDVKLEQKSNHNGWSDSKAYKDYQEQLRKLNIQKATNLYRNQAMFKPWGNIPKFDPGWIYKNF